MPFGGEKSPLQHMQQQQQLHQQQRRSLTNVNPEDDELSIKETSWTLAHFGTDYFSTATIGVAIAGFLIAFASSILSTVRYPGYPNFSWWSLFYMLFCIIFVIIAVGMNSVPRYHSSLVGFLAGALVFNTSSVNSLIYANNGPSEAAAAGFILLSMVCIVWIFRYGEASVRAERKRTSTWMKHFLAQQEAFERRILRADQSQLPSATVTHPHLGSLEQSSPHADTFDRQQQPYQMGQMRNRNGLPHDSRADGYAASTMMMRPQSSTAPEPINPMLAQTQQGSDAYPYRAKAIYTYQANEDDANEISFDKHDILEVSDISGRWWQARKNNGETGIAPSNYLILL